MNSPKCLLKHIWTLQVYTLILCVRLRAVSQNRGTELVQILNHLHTCPLCKAATEKIRKFILPFEGTWMSIWWTLVLLKNKFWSWLNIVPFILKSLAQDWPNLTRIHSRKCWQKTKLSVMVSHSGGENTPLLLIGGGTQTILGAGVELRVGPLWPSYRIPPWKLRF